MHCDCNCENMMHFSLFYINLLHITPECSAKISNVIRASQIIYVISMCSDKCYPRVSKFYRCCSAAAAAALLPIRWAGHIDVCNTWLQLRTSRQNAMAIRGNVSQQNVVSLISVNYFNYFFVVVVYVYMLFSIIATAFNGIITKHFSCHNLFIVVCRRASHVCIIIMMCMRALRGMKTLLHC